MKLDNPNEVLYDREDNVRTVLDNTTFTPATETLALPDALGRVSAHAVMSRNTLPNMRTTRLDGIGIKNELARSMPLETPLDLQEGTDFSFVNCGIGIPEQYDSTIRIENIDFEDGKLVLHAYPGDGGETIFPAGSEIVEGETLLDAHTVLSPAHLGLLAMGGHEQVEVVKKPVVAIIPSGDELVDPRMKPPLGKNIESNSTILAAKVTSWGGQPLVYRIVPDDPEQLKTSLVDACNKADIVFYNAGSSKGTADFALDVLKESGTLFFHRVAYGPGHHTGFALVDGVPVLALVGPPIGADFNADFYGKPLIYKYLGLPEPAPVKLAAKLDMDIPAAKKVSMWLRAMVSYENGEFIARACENLRERYADANAFVHVTQDESFERGSSVQVELREPIDWRLLAHASIH